MAETGAGTDDLCACSWGPATQPRRPESAFSAPSRRPQRLSSEANVAGHGTRSPQRRRFRSLLIATWSAAVGALPGLAAFPH
jgi:hypothetical protein